MGDDFYPWEQYRLPMFGVAKILTPDMQPDVVPLHETWTPYLSDQVVVTHPRSRCEGRFCAVHNPSDHDMREWMQWFEDGITYRVCPHGENHADPDEIRAQMLVRGCVADCDGCCLPARYAPLLEASRRMTLKARKTIPGGYSTYAISGDTRQAIIMYNTMYNTTNVVRGSTS